MECPNCKHKFEIKLGSKIVSKGAKVLTAMTTIVTAQCEKCGTIMQVPISSKSFLSVKKAKED